MSYTLWHAHGHLCTGIEAFVTMRKTRRSNGPTWSSSCVSDGLIYLFLQLCFGNGRLEEFLLDQTVTAVQMQTPPIAVCVAAAMAMFNFTQLTKLPHSERSHPICWGRLRSWAGSMQKLYTKEELAEEHIDNANSLVISLCKQVVSMLPNETCSH